MSISIAAVREANLERFCSLSGPGELTPENVRVHDPDALIVFEEAGVLAARASLWWSHVPGYPGEQIGLIGHYAANDARAAAQILSAACSELARHGCTLAVGPMDGSTWRRYRLLTERGTEPPFFLEPGNPDDWPMHFENHGFYPLARYYSALNAEIRRQWVFSPDAAAGFAIRPLDPGRIEDELQRLWTVAIRAFAGNFLYMPVHKDEFRDMYLQLLPLARPELVLIAERDGAPAGFCFAVPDILQSRRGQPIDTVIIKTVAVLPEWQGRGLGSVLISRANEAAAGLGMSRSIHALMHEANPSRRIGRAFLRDFRGYTLYARQL